MSALRNNGCDCMCRIEVERQAADCIEAMARKLATSHLVMATAGARRMVDDKTWLEHVPAEYRYLVADEQ